MKPIADFEALPITAAVFFWSAVPVTENSDQTRLSRLCPSFAALDILHASSGESSTTETH